jgi:hypothetical protein
LGELEEAIGQKLLSAAAESKRMVSLTTGGFGYESERPIESDMDSASKRADDFGATDRPKAIVKPLAGSMV